MLEEWVTGKNDPTEYFVATWQPTCQLDQAMLCLAHITTQPEQDAIAVCLIEEYDAETRIYNTVLHPRVALIAFLFDPNGPEKICRALAVWLERGTPST